MGEGQQVAPILPGADEQEGVETQDQVQVVARPERGREMAHGVDGIGGARAGDLDVGNAEARPVRHRQPHHLEPVMRRRSGPAAPVRRHAARNEADLVQRVLLFHLLGAPQVAEVDRVEGAAEQAESHGGALTLALSRRERGKHG